MYGVYHQQGYYGGDGYYYSNAQAIGYCPPYGAPDYYANCGGSRRNNTMSIIVLVACCGLCVLVFLFSRKNGDGSGDGGNQTPLLSVGDPVTREGRTVSRGNAILFLRAIEAEYLDGVDGEVGRLFDRVGGDGADARNLECEEDAVRNAGDKEDAVFQLAIRWDMRYELSRR